MSPSFWDYLLLTFLCCLVVVFVVVAVVVVVVATVGDPHRGTEETTVLQPHRTSWPARESVAALPIRILSRTISKVFPRRECLHL